MRAFITFAKGSRCFQYDVPMVLGIISENINISIVVMAETSPNHSFPNIRVVCLPTPAAPIVLAMVLRDRIAAIGLSISVFSFMNNSAFLSPSSSLILIKETGVDINTDSSSEHKKEIANAPNRNTNKSPINYKLLQNYSFSFNYTLTIEKYGFVPFKYIFPIISATGEIFCGFAFLRKLLSLQIEMHLWRGKIIACFIKGYLNGILWMC